MIVLSSRHFFHKNGKGSGGVKGDHRAITGAVRMEGNTTKSTTTATTTKSKSSSRKAKDGKSTTPPLKVVIRRLPHQLTEEEFLAALTSVAAEAKLGERVDSWDLVHFAPGKMSKKRGRVTSTAYLLINRGRGLSADLSLIKLRTAVLACEVMAGTAAKDGKSGEKIADAAAAGPMVVAAPFQKLFKQKPKKDIRVGTIEKDSDFKAFCASLQSPPPPLPSADAQVDMKESEGKEEPRRENALLDFLNERGSKKRKDSQRSAGGGSSSTGSASRGSRRGPSPTGGSGGSTTSSITANAVTVLGASATTKSKPTPLSSSSATASSTSKPAAEKEPPKVQNGRSGGGSGGSNSRASRGNSSASSRATPPSTAKEQSSEPGKETTTSAKEKAGGGRRGGGGGKARASGRSSGGGSGGGS